LNGHIFEHYLIASAIDGKLEIVSDVGEPVTRIPAL
jgi:hypothetical protein